MYMPFFSLFYETTRFLLGLPQMATMEILSLKHCKDAQKKNGNIKNHLLIKLYFIIATSTFTRIFRLYLVP